MSAPDYLFCAPIHEGHIEGSVQTTCRRCRAPIWLSLSGQEYLAAHPEVIILCLPHLAQMVRDGTAPFDLPVKAIGPGGKVVGVGKDLLPYELNEDYARRWIPRWNEQ